MPTAITLSNLYLISRLLGREQDKLDIWHGSNYAEEEYLEYVPPEIWALWDADAMRWAQETVDSPQLCQVRARYIAIYEQLESEPPGLWRSAMVDKVFRLGRIKPERQ